MDETSRLILMKMRQRMRSPVGRDWSSLAHRKVSTCRQILRATSCLAVVCLGASVKQPPCPRRAELGVGQGLRGNWDSVDEIRCAHGCLWRG